MPEVITRALGYINEVSGFIGNLLHPFINFVLVVGALVIVLGCLFSAFDHLRNIHNDHDVLGAAAMGVDIVVATVLLSLGAASDALNLLYLVTAGTVAMGARLIIARVAKGK